MKLTCPTCKSPIDAANINIQADTALCTNCGSIHQVSAAFSNQWEIEPAPVSRELGITLDDYPPKGSKLEIYETSDGEIELFQPANGFSGGSLFLGGFATFWLCFVAFWTWGAASGSIFFALFSIPFWFVGIGLMTATIRGALEKQYVRVRENALVLLKKRVFGTKTQVLPFDELDAVSGASVTLTGFMTSMTAVGYTSTWRNSRQTRTANGNDTTSTTVPHARIGLKQYPFFENASDIEREWVVMIIKKLVKERSGKEV